MDWLTSLHAGQLGLSITALILGALIQGAAGFGFGLVTTPLLLWAGLPLPVAVALVLTGTLVQTGAGCFKYRTEIVWRDTWSMMMLRTLAMPIGLAAMVWVNGQGLGVVKQIVGSVLLAVVVLIVSFKPQPRLNVSGPWTAAAGASSGLLSGLIGMGGPPLVLWVMAHDWSPTRSRVFMWLMFFQLMPIQLAAMGWRFGGSVWTAMIAGFVFTPVLVGAGMLGTRLGQAWSREKLRAITLAMLVALAISSILGPWLS